MLHLNFGRSTHKFQILILKMIFRLVLPKSSIANNFNFFVTYSCEVEFLFVVHVVNCQYTLADPVVVFRVGTNAQLLENGRLTTRHYLQ